MTKDVPIEATEARRKPSHILLWFLAIIVAAVLGWTGVWLFAAQQTGQVLQAWMAREKSFGRIWSCPHPRIGGYPTGIAISCISPHFAGLIFGHQYSGTLQSLRATADLSHPRDIDLDVASPFAATSSDDKVNFELAWRSLKVRLNGSPNSPWRAIVTGQNIELHGNAGEAPFSGTANDVAMTALQRPDGRGQALDFDVTLKGTTLPAINKVLGSGPPSDIAAAGTVTEANADPNLTPAQNLARWQTAGGHVDLTTLILTRGATKFQAQGRFAIDASHRIDGHFDTRSSGLEPILQHYGIDPSLLSVGTFLSNLFGGHSNESSKPQSAELHLSVDINDGRIAVGPVQTDLQLPPAY